MSEFQKVLDNRGAGALSIFYALSYRQQARAFALAGDSGKSRQMYEKFLTLWKDADEDVPVLMEAKREYKALK